MHLFGDPQVGSCDVWLIPSFLMPGFVANPERCKVRRDGCLDSPHGCSACGGLPHPASRHTPASSARCTNAGAGCGGTYFGFVGGHSHPWVTERCSVNTNYLVNTNYEG